MTQLADIQGKAPVRGRVVAEALIPAKAYAAFEVQQGQVIRVVDVEGEQVPDVVFFNRQNLDEKTSMQYSRSLNRAAMLTTGHYMYSLECNRLAKIVGDTVGVHDLNGAFCSEPLNYVRYGERGTRNCRDNLAMAVAPYGLTKKDITEGCCLAPFMTRVVGEDGSFTIGPPASRAGDYIEFQAEMDLLVAVSACPTWRNPCNGFNPTSVGVIVYEPEL